MSTENNQTTQEERVVTHLDLGYSLTASINLNDLMEGEGIKGYTPLDIKTLFAKYDTLYITMNGGEEFELDILNELCLSQESICFKYASSTGVYEERGGIMKTLAESDEYGDKIDIIRQDDDESNPRS